MVLPNPEEISFEDEKRRRITDESDLPVYEIPEDAPPEQLASEAARQAQQAVGEIVGTLQDVLTAVNGRSRAELQRIQARIRRWLSRMVGFENNHIVSMVNAIAGQLFNVVSGQSELINLVTQNIPNAQQQTLSQLVQRQVQSGPGNRPIGQAIPGQGQQVQLGDIPEIGFEPVSPYPETQPGSQDSQTIPAPQGINIPATPQLRTPQASTGQAPRQISPPVRSEVMGPIVPGGVGPVLTEPDLPRGLQSRSIGTADIDRNDRERATTASPPLPRVCPEPIIQCPQPNIVVNPPPVSVFVRPSGETAGVSTGASESLKAGQAEEIFSNRAAGASTFPVEWEQPFSMLFGPFDREWVDRADEYMGGQIKSAKLAPTMQAWVEERLREEKQPFTGPYIEE